MGLGRVFLAVLADAYHEDEMDGETRVVLKLKPSLAPVVCAVSPLLKNRPELQEKAREVYAMLKKEFGRVMYDDNGNVGKRYRRQDEIGTPWCIVVDFDTIGQGENINPDWKDMVTIRDRDTGTQERVAINDLASYIKSRM
jgi:glycyl-tRNA synthetase